ncbi:hypothetical protein [Algoriphagus aquimarinus]|uniref:hypothetical protein n=1 Tax=Algoriphagus aquimarinus TaxID=237018 RepID=UPI0030DDBF7A|tara:strand:- start:24350 stop:24802 length:453 start_codon:yes stop_codon:yes gene_type:complete
MRNLLLILAIALFSTVYGQESTDTLTYVKTEIIVPEGCSAKSKYEVMECNGFSAQWLYLKQEMIDQGVDKQLFSQLEQQFQYSKKSNLKFKSQNQGFEGYQYKMKNGTTRILGLGKVDSQSLILNLGFEDMPKRNGDLSEFEKNFIELEK